MKRVVIIVTISILLGLICFISGLAENKETYTCGDYTYILLDDGTAEITHCYALGTDELIIPDTLDGYTVTRIGDMPYAFDCFNLTKVTIPDSIVEIDMNPFYASRLQTIEITPDNPYFTTEDEALINKTDGSLVCFPSGIYIDEYLIPQNVKKIGSYAFVNCDIKTIIIPDNFIELGDNPFINYDLKMLKISPDNPNIAIIDGVLFSKTDKRLVSYPSSLPDSEYSVPQGIKMIGNSAFYFNFILHTVNIPDSVINIGNDAFANCHKLQNISLPDSITSIGDAAFSGCYELLSIHIPINVTRINAYAFASCEKLQNIILSDNVTEIADYAFAYCTNLQSIIVPNSVVSIGANAFTECTNLTITVGRNSYAKQYCINNGIPYTYVDVNDWLNN